MNFQKILFVPIVILFCACGNGQVDKTKETESSAQENAKDDKKVIMFFGDSLTAGYGLDDESQAFPGVIQTKIDSLKLPYKVINAGVSGETSAGGLARIKWTLKKKIDIFVLELGANDGLRGTAVSQTTENLQAIITAVKTTYPKAKILLLGMQVPPSMGATYSGDFKDMYKQLADQNKIDLVPFLLDKVGGISKLNQADGIHPTAEGAKIVADNVWSVLKGEL
ncbi:arylesterase [Mucilaginibacter conchicola]|uniref:Arylesterase n=1 Tax=Mucilaginibacter conchicola TaxID=2303333 RepID=A0A372NQP0_9SPHI|nr:arylesterase [Mucilaginibacter conchicola]RFZ91266.1 arylesterase [Mucilaginibacter conchicola]